jgi:5'-nucleotidase
MTLSIPAQWRQRQEGRHLGFPALAVSLDGHQHYETAAAVTCAILRGLTREPLRTGRILNVSTSPICR